MLEPRPTVSADTPGIWALIAEVYGEYGLILNVEADEPHLIEPGSYFRAHGGQFWVVCDEQEVVRATVAIKLHVTDESELKSLYVQRTLRRQGWGQKLTEMAMEYARQMGKREMILWSDTRFVDAHRLYRRMGFAACGLRDLHDTNNSIEFGFKRSLL